MKLIFTHTSGFVPALIRLWEDSYWNHVAIITPDDKFVVEAQWGVGVSKRSLCEVKRDCLDYIVYEFDTESDVAGINWAYTQLGLPYDYLAIIAYPFNRDWQDETSWYCCELALRAAQMAGQTVTTEQSRYGLKFCEDMAYKWALKL